MFEPYLIINESGKTQWYSTQESRVKSQEGMALEVSEAWLFIFSSSKHLCHRQDQVARHGM